MICNLTRVETKPIQNREANGLIPTPTFLQPPPPPSLFGLDICLESRAFSDDIWYVLFLEGTTQESVSSGVFQR